MLHCGRVSETATRKIGGEDIVHQQLSQEDSVEEDNVSIVSESSFGSEILTLEDVQVPPHNVDNTRRRRRNRVDTLGLPGATNLPRLRARR